MDCSIVRELPLILRPALRAYRHVTQSKSLFLLLILFASQICRAMIVSCELDVGWKPLLDIVVDSRLHFGAFKPFASFQSRLIDGKIAICSHAAGATTTDTHGIQKLLQQFHVGIERFFMTVASVADYL
ncbi:hypothetical protein Tco_0611459 [Tanacetum coccineum]